MTPEEKTLFESLQNALSGIHKVLSNAPGMVIATEVQKVKDAADVIGRFITAADLAKGANPSPPSGRGGLPVK